MAAALFRLIRFWALLLLTVTVAAQPVLAQAAPQILRDTETETFLKDISEPLAKSAGLAPGALQIVLIQDPEINAFVAGGQIIYIQSGLIEEKIFACFTWPAIMIWVMPSSLQISISRPNWPSETQWQRAATASTSGEASSLMAIATASSPCLRAVSSARMRKRPLPAMIPYFIP